MPSTRTPSVVDLVGLDEGLVALWPGALVLTLARRDPGLASTSSAFQCDLLFDPHRPLLSRPELADLAGATREMTGRVIRDFERRGLVGRTGRGGLVLLDPESLRAEAGIAEDEPTH